MKRIFQIKPLIINLAFFIAFFQISTTPILSQTPAQPYHNLIHNFGTNYNNPSNEETYASQHRQALQLGYSAVSNGKPNDGKYSHLGVIKDHNAFTFPLFLKELETSNKKFHYLDYYHQEFDETIGKYKSAFDPSKYVPVDYDIDENIVEFIKSYACAKPGADLDQLSLANLSAELLDNLFYASWVLLDSNNKITGMTLVANWQSKAVVEELVQKTVDSLGYERVDGIFFDQFSGGLFACGNAGYGGKGAYESWEGGQKDFIVRIVNQIRTMKGAQGRPYFVVANIGNAITEMGKIATRYYADGSLRFDYYNYEWGNLRDPVTKEISIPMDANGLDPETGKPAYVSQWGYIPADRVGVCTEGGWYTSPNVRDRELMGVPYREDEYRDDQNCYPLPVEDDYFTQHLKACGIAGKQGSWFGYFGESYTWGKDLYICDNGKPRLKTNQERKLIYTSDRQLLRTIPNWDNLLNIPLEQRQWDPVKLVYQSPNSYASEDVIYSRHFQDSPYSQKGELFVAFVTLNGQVILKPGESVNSAYFVNKYFEKTIDDARRCLNINGNIVTLKPECSDKLKVGLRISSTIPPYQDGLVARWNFDEGSGTITHDSINGNDGTLINGTFWTTGIHGRALQFDGIDDYANFQDTLNMETSDMSISLWIKTASTSYTSVITKAYEVPYFNLFLSSKIYVSLHNGSDLKQLSSSEVINDNKWHHLVAVWDRDDKMKIYVDGKEDGSLDISADKNTLITNNNLFTLGTNCKYQGQCGDKFAGVIDEARIYNRVLTQSEVEALFTEGSSVYDLNRDFIIDYKDILELLPLFYFPGEKADFNNDGKVNSLDFSDLINHFN